MEKKAAPHGKHESYSTDGILVMSRKDKDKVVSVLSSDVGVEPLKTILQYDKQEKKVEVSCANVIKEYNGKIVGSDKSNKLTHLCKSPKRAKR